MTANDFRRLALLLEGAEEGSHMGAADFRVGGRIFATLASVNQGYGNLMLSPEQQAVFVEEQPDLFLPVAGGWGRNGATHIRLAAANEDVLAGALHTAWKLRVEKNEKTGKRNNTHRGEQEEATQAVIDSCRLLALARATALRRARRLGLSLLRAFPTQCDLFLARCFARYFLAAVAAGRLFAAASLFMFRLAGDRLITRPTAR